MEAYKMSDEWPQSAIDYVQAIADTKLLLSAHQVEHSVSGPSLEDSVAAASIAQDEFGHVRQLFQLLGQQSREMEWLEGYRKPTEYANASTLDKVREDWAEYLVQVAVTDYATWLMLDAIDHPDFQGMVEKISEDEYFHIEFYDGWIDKLATNQPDVLADDLEESLASALALLGPPKYKDEADPLIQLGFTSSSVATLRSSLIAHYKPTLETVGLEPDQFTQTPSESEWDENRRRIDGGSISESMADSLKGVQNQEFAVR